MKTFSPTMMPIGVEQKDPGHLIGSTFTHSQFRSLIHSIPHSLIHPLTHSFTPSRIQPPLIFWHYILDTGDQMIFQKLASCRVVYIKDFST